MHNRLYCYGCGGRMNKFYVGLLNNFDPNIEKNWTHLYTGLGIHYGPTAHGEVVKVDNLNETDYYRYAIIHKDEYNKYLAMREFEIYGNYINYIGCYEDFEDSVEVGTKMKLVQCINECDYLNNTYAGLKDGKNCFCGNQIKQSRPLIECDIVCDNNVDYCGGNNLLSVFNVYPLTRGKNMGSKYIGCFEERPIKPEFTLTYAKRDVITIETCQRFCLENYYLYFALQNGSMCLCNNTYFRYGKANETECNTPCSGDNKQRCGGTDRNSIYSINQEEDGLNFSRLCYHCKDGGDLDIDGICKNKKCEDGWAGESCSMRDCDNNNGDCQDHECKKVPAFSAQVSECVCKSGYSKSAWWETCIDTRPKLTKKPRILSTSNIVPSILFLVIIGSAMIICMIMKMKQNESTVSSV